MDQHEMVPPIFFENKVGESDALATSRFDGNQSLIVQDFELSCFGFRAECHQRDLFLLSKGLSLLDDLKPKRRTEAL
jgi:hypothetical protein